MVHLQSLNEMRDYWAENRDRILSKYSSGFIVVYYSPGRHRHFDTREEVYKKHPVLKEIAEGKVRFGTFPLVIDVTEAIFEERTAKPSRNSQIDLLRKIRETQTEPHAQGKPFGN
ncbi:Uncharacterised protein [uncultured archaeon]|nr:Uncharacterised protein [uncultured archaeon]